MDRVLSECSDSWVSSDETEKCPSLIVYCDHAGKTVARPRDLNILGIVYPGSRGDDKAEVNAGPNSSEVKISLKLFEN